jgi:hypothetical protein
MSDASSPAVGTASEPWVQVTGSPRLWNWLVEQRVSLAFTTYQTGKLFLLGRHPEGRLAVVERTFNRAMGLWADGQTLWMSTLVQLWRFENLLKPGGPPCARRCRRTDVRRALLLKPACPKRSASLFLSCAPAP